MKFKQNIKCFFTLSSLAYRFYSGKGQEYPTVYSGQIFTGTSQAFAPGVYDACSLGGLSTVGNDAARSVYLPAGFVVTLFQDCCYNPPGPCKRSVRLTASSPTLTGGFDRQMSGLIVSATGPYPALHSGHSFTGLHQTYGPGTFDLCNVGGMTSFGNDATRSVYIPPGYIVTLFQSCCFNPTGPCGNYTVLTKTSPVLPHLAEIVTFGVIVAAPGPYFPVLYAGQYFSESSQVFGPGTYDACAIGGMTGVGNDLASSVYVPAGYTVTLFQDCCYNPNRPCGKNITLTASLPVLSGLFDNQVSGLVVQKIGISSTFCDADLSSSSITCANGELIQIQSATYGRTSPLVCTNYSDASALFNTACSIDVASIVGYRCSGRNSCQFSAPFVDPCVGTYKYLDVSYECVCCTVGTHPINVYWPH